MRESELPEALQRRLEGLRTQYGQKSPQLESAWQSGGEQILAGVQEGLKSLQEDVFLSDDERLQMAREYALVIFELGAMMIEKLPEGRRKQALEELQARLNTIPYGEDPAD